MNDFPPPPRFNEPFDLDAAKTQIGEAMNSLISTMVAGPGQPRDAEAATQIMKGLISAIGQGSAACAEVKRLRDEIAGLRDAHRPRPHADPSAPGALCDACSLHGVLVNWPCATWHSADGILARKAV